MGRRRDRREPGPAALEAELRASLRRALQDVKTSRQKERASADLAKQYKDALSNIHKLVEASSSDSRRILPVLPPGQVSFAVNDSAEQWRTMEHFEHAPRPPCFIDTSISVNRQPAHLRAWADGRKIRQGSTGVVFGGIYHGQRVAIKVPFVVKWTRPRAPDAVDELPKTSEESESPFFCNEIRVNAHLLAVAPVITHVAQPVGVISASWDDSRGFFLHADYPVRNAIVFEWLGDDPSRMLKEVSLSSPGVADWITNGKVLVTVLVGMAIGVSQLHSAGIVHYDLKSSAFSVSLSTLDASVVSVKVLDLSHAKLTIGADASVKTYDAPEPPRTPPPPNARHEVRFYPTIADLEGNAILAATPWLDVFALGNIFKRIVDHVNVDEELKAALTKLTVEMKGYRERMMMQVVVDRLELMLAAF